MASALDFGPGGLRALYTPGHAPGHLCFVDERSRAVVAGDMVASVGTIIVEPDDGGDMAVYLESLARLRADERARCFCRRTGRRSPTRAGGSTSTSRTGSSAKRGCSARSRASRARSSALVPPAYPDVAPAIYPLAARSLLAHLLKLEHDGRARRDGDRWALA